MLAIKGNSLGAVITPCGGDRIQILTQCVHCGHIHLTVDNKPIR